MAYETGTVSNLKAAFEKLRSFLTSNTTLAAQTPSQVWQELAYIEDNVESASTNMTLGTNDTIQQMLRAEPRLLPNHLEASTTADTEFTNFVGGTSFIRWKLRTAKPVTKLRIKSSYTTQQTTYQIRSFRLQWSDDDNNWTTVTTQTNLSWAQLEFKEWSGWAATGSHLYWRILIDTNGTGQTTGGVYLRQILCWNGTEIVNSSSSETYLKGPGLGGTDEIFIGFRTITDPIKSWYLIQVMGFTGYLSGELCCFNQPGSINIGTGSPFLSLWDNSMTYWITGSGRRTVFTFKVSTVYEAGYAGFILPYATPVQYPYPLAIGGTMCSGTYTNYGLKYDLVNSGHSVFCMPRGNTGHTQNEANGPATDGTLFLLQPSGTWEAYSNGPGAAGPSSNSEGIIRRTIHAVLPHGQWASNLGRYALLDCVGGGYLLQPHQLYHNQPAPARFMGELDGTRQISGQNNASENTGTYNGHNYVVFQNAYRTAKTEYWAQLAE